MLVVVLMNLGLGGTPSTAEPSTPIVTRSVRLLFKRLRRG